MQMIISQLSTWMFLTKDCHYSCWRTDRVGQSDCCNVKKWGELRICIDFLAYWVRLGVRYTHDILLCHMGDIVSSVSCLASGFRVKYLRNISINSYQVSLVKKCIPDDVFIHGTCEADHDNKLDGYMCRRITAERYQAQRWEIRVQV